MPGALSQIRVLDLTRVLAGPWCTQNLADLGADVIKVERPGVGDDTRHWGPPWVPDAAGRDTTDSTYFTSANRNKRSITVDMSKIEGQEIIREIAATSDVLVENYKVGDLARYGLSYDALKKDFPRLIYCSVTGYGQSGPSASRPGYDYLFQAEGGLMSITGERDDRPGGGPMKVGTAISDILAGLYATIAILAALEARHATGAGQYIDVALLDATIAASANQVNGYLMSGEIPKRMGNSHANIVPYQPFHTSDGLIVIACANDGQYRRLCAVLERPDLAADERFKTTTGRSINREALLAEIETALKTKPAAHWSARLLAAEVPSGGINDFRQVYEHPQVVYRGMRHDMPHGAGGTATMVSSPLRLEGTPVEYRLAPPLLGQHTAEVLREVLRRSQQDIEQLRARGVV